jgi:hypothetical protein
MDLDCEEFYDPCSGSKLNKEQWLERAKSIKKHLTKVEKNKPMPLKSDGSKIETRYDLLEHLLKQDTKPDSSIFHYSNGEQDFSPHLFEAYWDIVISLGFLERCRLTKDRLMLKGKVEDLKKVNFKEEQFVAFKDIFIKYLQAREVAATNSSGASDITVVYMNEYVEPIVKDKCSYNPPSAAANEALPPLFYLFSSKFYKSEKSTGDYDVERIHLASKKLRENNTGLKVKIPILAKNKLELDGKLERALSRFVADEIDKPIEGLDELLGHLNRLYTLVRAKYTKSDEITLENLSGFFDVKSKEDPKDFLSLRFHQQMAVDKISESIKTEIGKGLSDKNNKFLVGILPRGGKTYVAGGIIYALQAKRVLVILGAKTETEPQFIDELFKKFANFSDYNVINLLSDKGLKFEKGKKYIIVSSIELLVQGSSKDTKVRRELMVQLLSGKEDEVADLIMYDEAHLKGTRGKGKRLMDGKLAKKTSDEESESEEDEEEEEQKALEEAIEKSKNTPIVFFTGTYRKPRDRFVIPNERLFIWDYQDVQRAKNLDSELEYFRTNFQNADKIIEHMRQQNNSIKDIEVEYKKFPELFLISRKFTQADSPTMLGMGDLLTASPINKDSPELEWANNLSHPMHVKQLLNYLSPHNKATPEEEQLGKAELNESRFYTAIDCIDISAQGAKDRLRGISQAENIKEHLHSQLWFLPKTNGSKLQHRIKALASALMQHDWIGRNFNVICVYSNAGSDKITVSKKGAFPLGGQIVFQPSFCKGGMDLDPETGKHSLKTCIQKYEADCRNDGRGLIILAQDKLKLGVSLPCVDIVILLDDSKNPDERIQKMYRALTESDNKRCGFIVDMNYFRCMNSIIEYQLTRKKQEFVDIPDSKEFIQEIFTDIYAFNTHKYFTMEVSEGKQIKELLRDEIYKDSDSLLEYKKGSVEEAGVKFNRQMEELVLDIDVDDEITNLIRLGDKEVNTKPEQGPGVKAKGKVDQRVIEELKKRKEELRKKRAEMMAAFKEDLARGDPEAIAKMKKLEEEAKLAEDEYKEATKQTVNEALSEVYKFISKFAAFTSGSDDLQGYLENLALPKEKTLRVEIYDALVRRGAFLEVLKTDAEKDIAILIVLNPLIEKIKTSNINKDLYKIMAERVASYKCDDAAALKYISDNLTPKEEERHKYGEVFTPLTLVDEMLSKLPEHVWSEWDYKWLDPANGIGNFPLKAYLGNPNGDKDGNFKYPGLKNGLMKKYEGKKDEKEIIQHIFNDMLYMIEINPTNNKIAKEHVFGKCLGTIPGIKLNIEPIDPKEGFLSDKPLVFNGKEVKEFHVIMGNPPYNGGSVKSVTTNATRKMRIEKDLGLDKHKNLWVPFVKKSFEILREDGFLALIHPIGWFKRDEKTKTHDLILSHQILKMRIYFKSQAKTLFGGRGEISVAYYIVEKTPPKKQTEIINTDNKTEYVNLNKESLLCLKNNSIISKISSSKVGLFGSSADYMTTSITKNLCKDGINKQIHRITDSGDITFVKTSQIHKFQKEPKIILNGFKYPRYFYDKKGEYGLIGSHQHYFIGEKLDKLEDYFKTKLSAVLLSSLKYDMDYIEPKYYPDVRSLDIEKITDETLADYFDFTPEERAAIEAIEYPEREYTFKEMTCAELTKEAPTSNNTRKAEKPCSPPKETNPKTGKCVNPCPAKTIRNPKTGRCIKSKGGTRKIRR